MRLITSAALLSPLRSSAPRSLRTFLGLSLATCAALLLPAIPVCAQSSLYTFAGTTPVGFSAGPVAVSVSVSTPGATAAKAEVLTMGAPNQDFTESGSNSCPGTTTGNSCSVSVAFSPKYPGPRNGAVVLLDAGGNIIGTEYLTGTGIGPLAVFVPGAISIDAGQVGEWTQLNDGSPATQADLYLPSGVAVDGAGNLFIADSHHNRIREVLASTGNMITVAGDGSAGPAVNAPDATKVALNVPGGVAVDGAGNLFIADTNNNVIREVAPNGSITTVAGNGAPGYLDNTTAASAELNSPEGVTVDAAGNLYIADTGNNAIRKVSAGQITTVAGDGTGQANNSGDGGPATKAELNAPWAVAFDPSGNMFIADSANDVIRMINPSGIITTYAGDGTAGFSGDGGAATSAELNLPLGVACDAAGNLYIADARNYVVRKVSAAPTHTIASVAGNYPNDVYSDGKSGYTFGNGQSGSSFSGGGIASGAPANVTGAGIYAPYAVAVDPAGNLLIAEYFDHIIRKVTATQATLFFSPELWEGQTSSPQNQTIENDGNAALTFSAIAPDSNAAFNSGGSSCSTSGSYSLSVDSQCIIQAEFAPTAGGDPLVGQIAITPNAAVNPLTISTVGESLTQNQVSVTLSSTPNPGNFGTAVTFNVVVAQSPTSKQGIPTGDVTFSDTFNGATSPLGTAQKLGAGGNASIQLSNLPVGTHVITATYGGSTYYGSATSNTVTQVVTEQVAISVANTSGNNPSIVGSSVTFNATVSISGGITPAGTVSFYSNGTVALGSAALNGSGVATFSTSALPVGADSITATYTDINNVSAVSAPLIQHVQQQTATTLSSSANPSIHGNPITLTATILATGSVAPTGAVTFYDSGTRIGTGAITATGASSAIAVLKISTLTAGAHTVTATYGGDINDFSSSSGAFIQTVNDASTSTSVTASANPDVAGSNLVLSATVTSNGSTPAGTVQFFNNSVLLGTAALNPSGVATFTTHTLSVGAHSITAAYQGDSNNTSSTSAPLAVTVVEATTGIHLGASAASLTVTNPITFTATVTGNGGLPTGSVTFSDGASTLGTVALNNQGVATFTTSSLPVGIHKIVASYSGDANNSAFTSSALPITIVAFVTQTELAASATTLNTDQHLTLLTTTSSAGGRPATGTITFVSGSNTLGTATVGASGTASFSTALTPGSYSVVAQYSGDAFNAPSNSSPITINVGQATEFSVQLTPASLTIPSSKYATVNINLASRNSFSDDLDLGCAGIPPGITCSFSSSNVNLSANQTASVQLTVDTGSPLTAGGQAKNELPGPPSGLVAAFVFPGTALFGFAFWRFRRRTPLFRVVAVVVALVGATLLMNGCGGLSLNGAKPGNYVIQVTATGQKTGIAHVANLTIQVTQ